MSGPTRWASASRWASRLGQPGLLELVLLGWRQDLVQLCLYLRLCRCQLLELVGGQFELLVHAARQKVNAAGARAAALTVARGTLGAWAALVVGAQLSSSAGPGRASRSGIQPLRRTLGDGALRGQRAALEGGAVSRVPVRPEERVRHGQRVGQDRGRTLTRHGVDVLPRQLPVCRWAAAAHSPRCD